MKTNGRPPCLLIVLGRRRRQYASWCGAPVTVVAHLIDRWAPVSHLGAAMDARLSNSSLRSSAKHFRLLL